MLEGCEVVKPCEVLEVQGDAAHTSVSIHPSSPRPDTGYGSWCRASASIHPRDSAASDRSLQTPNEEDQVFRRSVAPEMRRRSLREHGYQPELPRPPPGCIGIYPYHSPSPADNYRIWNMPPLSIFPPSQRRI